MAGSLYHVSGVVLGSGGTELVIDTFYWIRKGFDGHGGFTRIASYNGVGGTGLGRYDGTDGGTSGDGRWAVWRKNTGTDIFDVWVGSNQLGGAAISTNPSGSYYIDGTEYGVGFAAAWHGSGEAWNGTTNNNGRDSFTLPWKSGSAVLPRTNGLWGARSGTMNDMTPLKGGYSFVQTSGTLHVLGDSDNFVIFADGGILASDPNNAIYSTFGGLFYVNPASGSFSLPYLQLGKPVDGVGFRRGVESDNFTNPSNGGVWITKPTGSNQLNSSSFGYGLDWDLVATSGFMPQFSSNPQTGSGSYSTEHPILVYAANPGMYLGHLDFLRVVTTNFSSSDRLSSGGRAVIGFGTNVGSTTVFTSCSLPWSSSFGVVCPASGTLYTSGNLFITSSLHGYSHVSQSYLYDRVALAALTTSLYRALSGSQFVYAFDSIPAGSDPVLIGVFRV